MEELDINGDESINDLIESNNPQKKKIASAVIESTGAPNRPTWVNFMLAVLFVGSFILFIVIFLEFLIFKMNLFEDPNPVWSQMLWFGPQFLLLVVTLQTMLFGVQTNILKAPSTWMVIIGFVAFVFDIVALFFYLRLFFQYAFKVGDLGTIENTIVKHHAPELSTVAWINFLFIFHSISSMVVGVVVYISDTNRFSQLESIIRTGYRSTKNKLKRMKKVSSSRKYESEFLNKRNVYK